VSIELEKRDGLVYLVDVGDRTRRDIIGMLPEEAEELRRGLFAIRPRDDEPTYPRDLAGGAVKMHAPAKLEPDVERWRALLQARADAAGFEHAIIDGPVPGLDGAATVPRFVICWPTGNEEALSAIVGEAFGFMLQRVQKVNEDKVAEKVAAWAEEECSRLARQKGLSTDEAETVEVLGGVLVDGIKAGEWRGSVVEPTREGQ
jgi:hypothetical protein